MLAARPQLAGVGIVFIGNADGGLKVSFRVSSGLAPQARARKTLRCTR